MKIHSGTVLGCSQSPKQTNHIERVQIFSFRSTEVKKVYPLLQFWHKGLFTLGIGDSGKLIGLVTTCMDSADMSSSLGRAKGFSPLEDI